MNHSIRTIFLSLALLVAGTGSSWSQDFDKGFAAAQSGDYATALQELRPLAEQGYASAQTLVGLMYATGRGVPQDDKEAVKWYRLSADQGVANAQYLLGKMYRLGRGVPQDYKEALKWYQLAAEQGNADAQNDLGLMYGLGQGVPQDYKEAVKSFRLAAEQGDALAQYNLGLMYENGEGVPQDLTRAHMWWNITAASGTDALLLSLMGLDIGPGDEVITTPFTFVATAEVIVLVGAKPVFVDIEVDTCNINPRLIEEKITDRTRAIMPVSLYGQVADMDEINAIAARYGNIPVIEDAAQSFGATYRGHKSCNLATIGCTSFFPSKPLGCYGDGGAIFTNDDALAQVFRELRVHGQSERYVHTRIGVGARMDSIQCAVLLAKLDRFEWEVKKRLEIGARYNDAMDAAGIKRIQQRPDRSSVFAQYTVLVEERERLAGQLNAAGIPTAVHYPIPLNEQLAYKDLCCPDCTPIAHQIAKQVISLPMGPDLSQEAQDEIVSIVSAFGRG